METPPSGVASYTGWTTLLSFVNSNVYDRHFRSCEPHRRNAVVILKIEGFQPLKCKLDFGVKWLERFGLI